MRYLKSAIYIILICFILVVSTLAFFLATTPGLYSVVALANLALPGKLHIQHAHGRLIDKISFKALSYEDNAVKINIRQGRFSWKLTALTDSQVLIKYLQAETVVIHIKNTPKTTKKTSNLAFELPQLPVNLQLQRLDIEQFKFKQLQTTHTINHIHLQLSANKQQWLLPSFSAHYANMQIAVKAGITPIFPYNAHATIRITPSQPSSPRVYGNLDVQGDFNEYHWEGTLKGPANASITGHLKNGNNLFVEVSWEKAHWPMSGDQYMNSPNGRLTISGPLDDLSIHANTDLYSPLPIHAKFNANVTPQRIKASTVLRLPQGNIEGDILYDTEAKPKISGHIHSQPIRLTDLNTPLESLQFQSTFSGNDFYNLSAYASLTGKYLHTSLKATVNLQPSTLLASVTLGPNDLSIKGKFPYEWQGTLTLPKPDLLHPSLKGLQTSIKGSVILKDAKNGQLHLSISPGIYQSLHKALPPLAFKGGDIEANLNHNGLTATTKIAIDAHKRLSGTLRLPELALNTFDAKKQRIQAAFSLNVDALDFLADLSTDISDTKGQLDIKLNTQGSLKNPSLTGNITLSNASAHLNTLNLTLNPIQLNLTTQQHQWQLNGQLASNGQSLSLEGRGLLTPEIAGALTIKGKDIPVMKTAEYTIDASPDLDVHFKPNDIKISGTIDIPNAIIKPISLSGSESLSSDAVFVHEKKDKHPIDISADLDIRMGKGVSLNILGLTGYLDGSLRIIQTPKAEPSAIGELRIRDGKYTAYGQDLTIQEGQLIFTGGIIANPGIRLRAIRTFTNANTAFSPSNNWLDFSANNIESLNLGNKTTVGIEMTGRVNAPKTRLFSIPSGLSQADILSLLILGRPANQASGASGKLLLTAISALNLDSGTKGAQLLNDLQQNLGVDIDLQTASQFNRQSNVVTEHTAVVIGKSITKRLYISYNIGLFEEDMNVFTLKYLLNKFFSIQVTASDSGSGMDLIYTRSQE